MPLIDPDLTGSITGIFKLEDTYLITPMQFAYGNASKNYPSLKLKCIKEILHRKISLLLPEFLKFKKPNCIFETIV